MEISQEVKDILERDFEGRVEHLRDGLRDDSIEAQKDKMPQEYKEMVALDYAVSERLLSIVRLLRVKSYEAARGLCAFNDEEPTDTDCQE